MNRNETVFIAGHSGLVGSAILRRLKADGYGNLLTPRSSELDLRSQAAVDRFDVPVYLLRVPVRYYRHAPSYFVGWRADAAPRWGDHWGHSWEQRRSGWNQWNRSSAPAPAPLPAYQRQYSGERYPQPSQQAVIQIRSYTYQPADNVARQHYQYQRSQAQAVPVTTQQRVAPQPQQQAAPQPQQQAAPQPQQRAPSQQQRPPQQQAQGHQQPPPAHEQRPPWPQTQPQAQERADQGQGQDRGQDKGQGQGQDRGKGHEKDDKDNRDNRDKGQGKGHGG